MRLIFQGKGMLDTQTLAEFNIKEGSIIHMILQVSRFLWFDDRLH